MEMRWGRRSRDGDEGEERRGGVKRKTRNMKDNSEGRKHRRLKKEEVKEKKAVKNEE